MIDIFRKGDIVLWCKKCRKEIFNDYCDTCGSRAENDIPPEIYWCYECNAPVIKMANDKDKEHCPLCGSSTKYLSSDLRAVYPEERLLIECLLGEPLKYINSSVWNCDSTYFFDGKKKNISRDTFAKANIEELIELLKKYKDSNNYNAFNKYSQKFVEINRERLNYLIKEAYEFIQNSASSFTPQTTIVSFSGGKDSTVTADLVVRALNNPNIVHVFGNTTLEFPYTIEYANRFRKNNPKTIFKIAQNKEQEFYSVCKDIGPPARMMRWCCSMFKTGPITRTLNNLYRDKKILTFYGIRKCESVSRSKYNRYEDSSESVKIQKQVVASPIFFWRDIDIWLYLIGENVDFNYAYRLGYDRVGCWCCPNNNERAQFLSKIYMHDEYIKWRNFLINFARSIGKPDPEVYVDTGKWKARQGGNGVSAAEDVKIKFTNCTAEEHAKIYSLNKPIDDSFYSLFIPFGKVSKELGRKLIGEVIVLDLKNNVPILSLQPFQQEGYDYSIKVKTMNVEKHEDLQRMVAYQIRKYNACRKCLKCESVCNYGAIRIMGETYIIDETKCKHCKKCINQKYLDAGCLMYKYLATRKD